MKPLIILVVCALSVSAIQAQSYELLAGSNDTINMIDLGGKKQGKWIVSGRHKPGTCYQPAQKIEEGIYSQNRKIGKWTEYYCNGKNKSDVSFVNGRPDGYAILYYENGNIKEEGDWKNNKWVGNYKLYYENGQVQHDFIYNKSGKREGHSVYFYDNGQVAVEGNFLNGKEAGLFKEYYENGDAKAIKTFNEGNVDELSIKLFEPKHDLAVKKTNEAAASAPAKTVTEVKKDEVVADAKIDPSRLNGKHILYNRNKQISKDGVFKDNRLMEGKAYIYDENGILTRVAIYKNGIYVGDGQAEK